MSDFPIGAVKTAVFEKIKVACMHRLSLREAAFVSNHLELAAHVDEMARCLVLYLESCVLGKKAGRIDIDLKYPTDWWQAVRRRWFPRWWLQRWPVKYDEIHVHQDIYRTCPHVNIKTPEGNRVHFQWLEEGK